MKVCFTKVSYFKVGKEISDLRTSLEITENIFEEKVQRLKEKYKHLENGYQELYVTQ